MPSVGDLIFNIWKRVNQLDIKIENLLKRTVVPDLRESSFTRSHSEQRNKISIIDTENHPSMSQKNELLAEIVKANRPKIETDPEKRKAITDKIKTNTNNLRDQIQLAQETKNFDKTPEKTPELKKNNPKPSSESSDLKSSPEYQSK